MKKKRFWYPIINLKNHLLFGSYGKDVYIEPGVVINRPRYVHIGDHVRIKRNTNINVHPSDKKSKEGILFIGKNTHITEGVIISAFHRIVIEEDVGIAPYVCIIDNSRKAGNIDRSSSRTNYRDGSCPYWSRLLACLQCLCPAQRQDWETLSHRCPFRGEQGYPILFGSRRLSCPGSETVRF